ncbi:hypothetical protein AB0F17_50505 [Nonomuraea sp. NPDC026600]
MIRPVADRLVDPYRLRERDTQLVHDLTAACPELAELARQRS